MLRQLQVVFCRKMQIPIAFGFRAPVFGYRMDGYIGGSLCIPTCLSWAPRRSRRSRTQLCGNFRQLLGLATSIEPPEPFLCPRAGFVTYAQRTAPLFPDSVGLPTSMVCSISRFCAPQAVLGLSEVGVDNASNRSVVKAIPSWRGTVEIGHRK